VINAATNTVAATIALPTDSNPTDVAVSPDSNTVYITNQQPDTVSVINAANYTIAATVSVGLDPGGVVVSPNGALVYVNENGYGTPYFPPTVSVINAATNAVTSTIAPQSVKYSQGRVQSVAVVGFSPNGNTTYVTDSYNPVDSSILSTPLAIGVLNTATNTLTGNVTVSYDRIGAVAVNPVTGYIYATVRNSSLPYLAVIDPTTMELVKYFSTPFAQHSAALPGGVAVSPDGNFVFITNYNANSISVISTVTYKVTATIPVGSNPLGIAVDPVTGTIYVTNRGLGYGNTVSVIAAR